MSHLIAFRDQDIRIFLLNFLHEVSQKNHGINLSFIK